ncbi:MAG: sugar phosphate isomerase/epimerase [Ruminococcus sp.]|nr:sugar phosphate isomerase/epimerase [Ruminococcus sp.]
MKLDMFADFTDRAGLNERLGLIADAGFDGVMLGFREENKFIQYEAADKAGLEIENVHSPFDRMNALWEDREDSGEILERTLECIGICGRNEVSKVIVHPTDGLVPPPVSDRGLLCFDRIVNKAAACGVTVLFENIQLPQFLDVLFEKFGSCENVGFCYDAGHENCFAKGDDRLARHGSLLGAVHIHDNCGDHDSHMIPFDGNIDFVPFLRKLKALDTDLPLSLELYMNKCRNYENVPCRAFTEKAYESAVRLRDMYNGL